MTAEKLTLRDRLGYAQDDASLNDDAAHQGASSQSYQQLKHRTHQALLDRVDLEGMQRLSREQIREELKILVSDVLTEDNVVINELERRSLIRDIQDEVLGFGPLEPLLADPSVSDILVNAYKQVYVERHGKLELTDVVLHRRRAPAAHHRQDRLARGPAHRRIEPHGRCAPARRLARQRHHSAAGHRRPRDVDPPLFGRSPLRMDDLMLTRSLTPEMAQMLQGLGKAKVNILISGGTGSGKTTLLNVDFRLHPHDRTHRHHRGRGRTADAAAARGAPGNAARQHRRQGRGDPARAGAQRAAHAARPHHHRRGARRRGAGHAAGHEHRPRRLDDHHPRQHPARRADAAGKHDRMAGRACPRRPCASRSARPSAWWSRWRA